MESKNTGKKEIIRSYISIPFNIMLDCQKINGLRWKNNLEFYLKEKGFIDSNTSILFVLSPNDLVYLPFKEALSKNNIIIDRNRIYKFIDPGMNTGNFIPYFVAKTIFSIKYSDQKKMGLSIPIQDEYGLGSQGSKSPRALTGEMIKETCIPIKVDRLGNVVELNGQKVNTTISL